MVTAVPVTESTQAGEARRVAIACAQRLGMDEETAGRVAIVASEMATNLFKHVEHGGEIIVNPLTDPDREGVELIALDRGAGISDLSRVDGVSSTGTAGTGLGAMARMADFFDIYTQPNVGTVLLARIWKRPPADVVGLRRAALSVPVKGEIVCGDASAYARDGANELFMVVDGLGHGPDAAEAAHEAKRVFLDYCNAPLARIIDKMHGALRATRGAAVAIACVDRSREAVRYVGVGNISGVIVDVDGARTNLVSQAGTLGHAIRTVTEFSYKWPGAGSTLVMHSDGIGTRWRLDAYPGATTRDPAILAALIYRDATRVRDDATVLIAAQPLR